MAIYRNININFWTDTKVSDEFTPEDKYFMLYCLTNNYTNLCGCYEISIKQISKDIGYDTESVEKLLKRFTEIHKIIFYNKENKELLIKNWHKYNWTKSEKLDKPLLKEIKEIKTAEFKRFVADEYNKRDTVSIPYIYPMDTTVSVSVTDTDTDTVSDNNININKEKERNAKVIKVYEENIGMITPASAEVLLDYLEDMNCELVIEAIKTAALQNKRSTKYIQGILNNWKRKEFKTLLDVENERKEKNKLKEETEEEKRERKKRELEEMLKDDS